MRHILLIGVAVVAGCVGGPELDESERTSPELGGPGVPPPEEGVWYEHEQGKFVIGSVADFRPSGHLDRYFRVQRLGVVGQGQYALSVTDSLLGANLTASTGGSVAFSGADDDFDGMVLQGIGVPGQLMIESADARVYEGIATGNTTYILKYRPDTNVDWEDAEYYCGSATMGAVAMRGSFDRRRIHLDEQAITFACDDSGGAKCIDWGYIPGPWGPSPSLDAPNGWDYHQACIPAVSADYCRRAEPHTREQTPIKIGDFMSGAQPPAAGGTDPGLAPNTVWEALQHPVRFPGDPDRYYIESAWRARDLVPYCVSKNRWASLPREPCKDPQNPNAECQLKDPRTDPNAKTCDEYTFEELENANVLIVVASMMMDAPVDRWRNSVTKDEVVTMRGFYIPSISPTQNDPYPKPSGRAIRPFPGYDTYLGPEGLILRNLTGVLEDEDKMIKLYSRQLGGGDRFVASNFAAGVLGVTAQPVEADFEGYAFKLPNQIGEALFPLEVCTTAPLSGDRVTLLGDPPQGCPWSGFARAPL